MDRDASFHDAKRLYLESYGDPMVTNTYLKIALALLSLVCVALALIDLRTIRTFENFRPLVIRIDDLGRAEAINYHNFEYKPQDAEAKYFLSQFTKLCYRRNRYTIQDDFAKSLYFLDGKLANGILDAYHKDDIIRKFLTNTSSSEIDIDVKKVSLEELQTPPYRARVDFYMVYYSPADHSELKRDLYTANFVSVFQSRVPNEYVFALHEPSDQVAVLVRNRIQHQTTQRILPAETIASAPFQSWLQKQNLAGADIFIGMNPVTAGARSRTKENIREIRHAYLDLDEDAGASLQAIRTTGDVPVPNFVLDTSPGKHQVVWRVEGFDTDQAESLLRALASQYGGDPAATDISRLLRLPGFTNRKYNEAFVVRVHHETDALYHGQDFHVQEDSPESPRHLDDSQQGMRKIPTGHRSQSEADWAYAKRALARGENPEQIIRNIADYRADDKADPAYYARLTVIKAQLSLISREACTAPASVESSRVIDRDV